MAALLSLPVPEQYPSLALSPQRQKQKTQEALVAWLLAETARQPVLAVWEDLHWADPSTLELLDLLLDHVPTARLLLVLTARPEFHPPWAPRSYVTQLTLTRLPRHQSEEMVVRVTGGKPVPAEVLAQIVAKTDGIPLFVEELVKTILEAGLVQEDAGRYVLTGPLPPLAIPATLQDVLMARLDRLAVVKEVAQLGAVLGREFAYELLRAVAPLDEATLQQALARLVEAELLYQRGLPPQAIYVFKHALLQDAAYQSLLKSTRQQLHQRIVQVLEAQFPDTVEIQPELLAHHYTAAGLTAEAISYWQRAGQRALARSANVEAIGHLTQGLALLRTLPDTPTLAAHELQLLTTLGPALMATQGYGAPEVEHTYTRARVLCQQMEETPQLAQVVFGLWAFYLVRAEYQTALELAEQLLTLAHRVQDSALLLDAYCGLAQTLFCLGELARARALFEQGLAYYDPQQHHALSLRYAQNHAVTSLSWLSWSLWLLGYPDQGEQKIHAVLTLAQEQSHSLTLGSALAWASHFYVYRRDESAAYTQAEAAVQLSTEQGLPFRAAQGMMLRGWALASLGAVEEGMVQLRQGLEGWRTTGAAISLPYFLGLLADVCVRGAQVQEGLATLAEALAYVDKTGERYAEAELHRLKGELLLAQVPPDASQAESCFRRALAIAQRQQAKSWELRAAMSLSRLWQRQGKRQAAHDLLAPIYGWFTEGFATPDLQEARALLDELRSH